MLMRLMRALAHFQTDTYIVSIPKSGRTWLRMLLGKAIVEGYGLKDMDLLDTFKITRAARVKRARFTHDGSAIMDGIPASDLRTTKTWYSAKQVVYLHRNVKDTLVSCFFQATKRVNCYSGTIEEFIRSERYGARKVLTFNAIWYANQNVPRHFLLLRYEDIQQNAVASLSSVLRFLGAEVRHETITSSVEFATFANMKKMEQKATYKKEQLRAADTADAESYKARKGKVGGYGEYLTRDDLDYIDGLIDDCGCPWDQDAKEARGAERHKQ